MITREASLVLREITGPLLVLDEQGMVVRVNDGFSRLLGLSAKAMGGSALSSFVSDDSGHMQALLRQFAGSGEWLVGFLTLRGADGALVEFPCQGKVLQRPRGDKPKLLVIRLNRQAGFSALNSKIKDVHAEVRRRHDTEFQLHLSSFAVDHASDAIFWVDPAGRFVMTNEQACRDLGYRREELLGMHVADLNPDFPVDVYSEHWQQLKREGALLFETEHRRKDGSVYPVEISATYLHFQGREFNFAVTHDISERKRADMALRQSEQMFSTAFNSSPVAAAIATAEDGRFMEVNQNYERDFGWARADLIGRTSIEVGLWPDESGRQRWVEAISRAGRMVDHETIWMHKSGTRRNVSLSGEITELNGKTCILAYATDITARKEIEADLRIAAAAFESQEGMIITDANKVILRVNRAFSAITGYTEAEVVGQVPRQFKSGRHNADFYRAMWDSINRTGGWQGEVWDRRKNGEEYPKWLTISVVKGADGAVTHYIGTHFDITERKKAEQTINELAFFDQLTGLPNRTLLLDRLKQAMTTGKRNATFGALLLIDLDNFKTLNDTRGHDTGDLLLKQAAQRLKACVREGDTVARLGGDEFVAVLAGLSPVEGDAAAGVETVTEKILAALSQPYQLGNAPHHSTASIGVTLFWDDVATADDLMKQADLAMYKAKAAGRNVVRFFDPTLESVVQERAALELDLRRAIAEKQFLLHYQAQIAAGRLTGAEALVRWQHPRRGMVSPADFIPLAEETGLILPLGNWVLETACAQLAAWAARPEMAHLTVAVNVSAHQFHQADFVEQVLAVLKRTGANPQRLKLELTESLLVSNVEEVIEKMFALKAKGVGFSLDDFGTGYSSLSYLKRLPLDQLKIDRSFVRDVLIDPNDASIAKTIIALAQTLGLGVIAEGVETEAQQDFLASSGCHAYQGYFFSRPLSVDAFEDFAQRA